MRERSREVNRLYKVLEDAGIKITSVATDVLGVSGRAMVDALVGGHDRPARPGGSGPRASCARNCRPSNARCTAAFGRSTRFCSSRSSPRSIISTRRSTRSTAEIDERLAPFAPMLTNLDTIPGVNRITAISILAETGGDMTRFLECGAPVQLGRDVSRARRKCRQTPHRQDPQSQPLSARRAHPKRARGAATRRAPPSRSGTAASNATAGTRRPSSPPDIRSLRSPFYIMRDGVTYHELGADYFDRRHRDRTVRRHVRQLEVLGYRVTIEEAA